MGLSAAARPAAQSFDRTAAEYDRLGDLSENDSLTSWLVSVLPSAGGRALDLGCGTGRHAVLLAGRFTHVDAIDVSPPMIEIARARRGGWSRSGRGCTRVRSCGSGRTLPVAARPRPGRSTGCPPAGSGSITA
jgi:SAM-dependent methyltransferase